MTAEVTAREWAESLDMADLFTRTEQLADVAEQILKDLDPNIHVQPDGTVVFLTPPPPGSAKWVAVVEEAEQMAKVLDFSSMLVNVEKDVFAGPRNASPARRVRDQSPAGRQVTRELADQLRDRYMDGGSGALTSLFTGDARQVVADLLIDKIDEAYKAAAAGADLAPNVARTVSLWFAELAENVQEMDFEVTEQVRQEDAQAHEAAERARLNHPKRLFVLLSIISVLYIAARVWFPSPDSDWLPTTYIAPPERAPAQVEEADLLYPERGSQLGRFVARRRTFQDMADVGADAVPVGPLLAVGWTIVLALLGHTATLFVRGARWLHALPVVLDVAVVANLYRGYTRFLTLSEFPADSRGALNFALATGTPAERVDYNEARAANSAPPIDESEGDVSVRLGSLPVAQVARRLADSTRAAVLAGVETTREAAAATTTSVRETGEEWLTTITAVVAVTAATAVAVKVIMLCTPVVQAYWNERARLRARSDDGASGASSGTGDGDRSPRRNLSPARRPAPKTTWRRQVAAVAAPKVPVAAPKVPVAAPKVAVAAPKPAVAVPKVAPKAAPKAVPKAAPKAAPKPPAIAPKGVL
jgi:hypothetical protein